MDFFLLGFQYVKERFFSVSCEGLLIFDVAQLQLEESKIF